MSRFLGIDPGAKGGIAVLNAGGVAEAWRYPGDIPEAAELVRSIHLAAPIKLACIEKVGAMPRPAAGGKVSMGAQSSFKFGANYGAWQGILSALGIPYVMVTPAKWQKALLDSGTGETKARSLNMARRLFPDVDMRFQADDGKADALHLARWAMREAER